MGPSGIVKSLYDNCPTKRDGDFVARAPLVLKLRDLPPLAGDLQLHQDSCAVLCDVAINKSCRVPAKHIEDASRSGVRLFRSVILDIVDRFRLRHPGILSGQESHAVNKVFQNPKFLADLGRHILKHKWMSRRFLPYGKVRSISQIQDRHVIRALYCLYYKVAKEHGYIPTMRWSASFYSAIIFGLIAPILKDKGIGPEEFEALIMEGYTTVHIPSASAAYDFSTIKVGQLFSCSKFPFTRPGDIDTNLLQQIGALNPDAVKIDRLQMYAASKPSVHEFVEWLDEFFTTGNYLFVGLKYIVEVDPGAQSIWEENEDDWETLELIGDGHMYTMMDLLLRNTIPESMVGTAFYEKLMTRCCANKIFSEVFRVIIDLNAFGLTDEAKERLLQLGRDMKAEAEADLADAEARNDKDDIAAAKAMLRLAEKFFADGLETTFGLAWRQGVQYGAVKLEEVYECVKKLFTPIILGAVTDAVADAQGVREPTIQVPSEPNCLPVKAPRPWRNYERRIMKVSQKTNTAPSTVGNQIAGPSKRAHDETKDAAAEAERNKLPMISSAEPSSTNGDMLQENQAPSLKRKFEEGEGTITTEDNKCPRVVESGNSGKENSPPTCPRGMMTSPALPTGPRAMLSSIPTCPRAMMPSSLTAKPSNGVAGYSAR